MVDDKAQSVLAWLRLGIGKEPPVLVVCNFTPVPRQAYRLGVPHAGRWMEILNTDAALYGGSGGGNMGEVTAEMRPMHGMAASASLFLPPLATLYFRFDGAAP